jgi:hypothetical protein
VIGTAVTEAVEDPEIRNSLAAGLRTIDADFEARLRTARERGELKDDADPAALAVLASATMHTIAIRARAGAPRAELREDCAQGGECDLRMTGGHGLTRPHTATTKAPRPMRSQISSSDGLRWSSAGSIAE